MTTAKTEEALISALVEGDERGVEELLGRYWAPAYRVAYQLTGDPGSAEDVAQEAFIRALRAIGRFDTAQPFRPWFFQILKNEARKHHRARARREGHEARAEAASRPSRDHDAVEAVHTYLAQLPEDQREPIALHYLGGFTLHEVGELLGCPKSTVNTRIRRGMDALRLRLQPTCAIAPAALIELLRSGPAAAAPPAAIELVAAARLSALAIPTPPASAELASAARRGGSWWLGGLLAAPLLAVTVVALLVSDPPSPEAVGAAPAWPSSSVVALASSVPDPEAPPEPPPSDASTPSDTSTPLEISTPPTFPQQGDPAPVLEEAMLHPDYERLKLYRTYARLDGASPYQHR